MSAELNIAVVIPTYNRATLLMRALESVAQQSLKPKEVIVVDDGSEDDTAELVKQRFPKVTLLQQDNRGVSSARNLGIQSTSADWVALLDSDDEWHRDKLAKQVAAIKAEPDSSICHCDEIWVRNGRRVNAMKKHAKQGGWIFNDCLPLCAISPSAVLIKCTVFESIGLFDEELPACEDYDLWLRITSRMPVLYIDEPLLTKYGGHADQLSQKHWGMDRFRITALEKILASDHLDPQQRAATLDMLNHKLDVLLTGARKRNNEDIIQCYSQKQYHYRKQHSPSASS